MFFRSFFWFQKLDKNKLVEFFKLSAKNIDARIKDVV